LHLAFVPNKKKTLQLFLELRRFYHHPIVLRDEGNWLVPKLSPRRWELHPTPAPKLDPEFGHSMAGGNTMKGN
jgi:hypothetical protein